MHVWLGGFNGLTSPSGSGNLWEVKAVVKHTIEITLPGPYHHSLLCCPKIKDVKNEKTLSEERGSKKGRITKETLWKEEGIEDKTNVILLKLCFWEMSRK